MNINKESADHGEYVPGRDIQVNYEPWRGRIYIYVRLGMFADGCMLYSARSSGVDGERLIPVRPGEEPPFALVLPIEEAKAIAEAIIDKKEEPSLRHLDDAIEVRDRMITLIESHAMFGDSDNASVNHITAEAKGRRSR